MKRNFCVWLLMTAGTLAALDGARAADLFATVRAVTGETVALTMDDDLLPEAGDKVEVFFKLAGAEDEVSVANGRVTKAEDDAVEIRIEEATGAVEKNHLARITSEKPRAREKKETYSLAGRWNVHGPDGKLAATLVFHPDGTAAFDVPQGQGVGFGGKYTFDARAKPPRFEMTNLRITPPPGLSKEDLAAFWAGLEQGLAASGTSLQKLEEAVAVGEFESAERFRFRQYDTRAQVPTGPIDPNAIVFIRSGEAAP